MLKIKTNYRFVFSAIFVILVFVSCGKDDHSSKRPSQPNTISNIAPSKNLKTKSYVITDPQVNMIPLTFPTSNEIQSHLDSLNLVKVIGPSVIPVFPEQPVIPESGSTSFVCYYDAFVKADEKNSEDQRAYRKVDWVWAEDKENSSGTFYLEGGRYPDQTFRASRLYSSKTTWWHFWSPTVKEYEPTFENIKNACINTLNTKIGEGNYRYLYSMESKNKYDYNRPLLAKDFTFSSYFRRIVAFGDSLSDTGNLYMRTGNKVPADPYYGGRFTNGFNCMDNLSAILKIPVFNWAYGAAETGGDTCLKDIFGVCLLKTISVSHAVDHFIEAKGISSAGYIFGGYGDFHHTLFSLFGGANNYNEYVRNNTHEFVVENADKYVEKTVDDIASSVLKLIKNGAQFILVVNLPNLSIIPEAVMPGAEQKQADLLLVSQKNNLLLDQEIQKLHEIYPKVTFIKLDTFGLFTDIASRVSENPDSNVYGILDSSHPCYLNTGNYVSNTAKTDLCSNPDTFLFWDKVHPTDRVHGFAAYLLTNALFPGASNTTSLSDLQAPN